jgi:hypothetical protein
LLGVGILKSGNLLEDEWVIYRQQDAKSCVQLQYSKTMKAKYCTVHQYLFAYTIQQVNDFLPKLFFLNYIVNK